MTAIPERTVGDLMSRDVLALSEDQDLQNLLETMRLFKFRHLPVTDDGKLVGLITHRDLLPNAREQTDYLAKLRRVRDVMTSDTKTVRPETPLVEAARILQHDKIGCLPVVDAQNTLVGIITDADFLRLALRVLESAS
jgi:CBS domain-containing protein